MFSIRYIREDATRRKVRCVWLAGIVMLVADAITLSWVAMLAALTAKNHGRATAKTAALILVAALRILFAAHVAGVIYGCGSSSFSAHLAES